MNDDDLQRLFTREFPLSDEISYLNHAAVAPWPQRTSDAVTRFARQNTFTGARHYPEWVRIESRLRLKLKTLIRAKSVDEISLTKSTSEALSFVAYGLSWQPGDEIIISDQEFPSNRIVWESLQEKFGVVVVVAPLNSCPTPEDAIISHMTDRTRLVSVSSVQYGTGLRLDLEKIGRETSQRGILFCVDAIQSVGAIHTDVIRDNIDFLMADGHKWMLGPEGLALFYVRKSCLDLLSLNEYGWHMVKDRGNYSRTTWEIAENATRFECGSPNMLAIHALNASLELILAIGIDKISELLNQKLKFLHSKLSKIEGLQFITDFSDNRTAGILTFTVDSVNTEDMYKELMDRGVICASRGGGVRFSPHFYTSEQAMNRAIGHVKACILNQAR